MKLDLGSGPNPKEGFVGIDARGRTRGTSPLQPGDVLDFDLIRAGRWPFADRSIEELHSSHFIEHIENAEVKTPDGMQDGLVWFMEEAWRVLRPGGKFTLTWPAYQDPLTKELLHGAFLDPTHRRFIPSQQLCYFTRAGRETLGVSHYGIECDFEYERCAYQRVNDDVGVFTATLSKPSQPSA